MNVNDIASIISSVGFPIVACIGIAIFFQQTNNNYRNDIKEMNSNHKSEMDKITEAINNNTLVIQKLVDRMEKEEKDYDK